MTDDQTRKGDLDMVDQVDRLSDEMKALALDVAIYLAKKKSESRDLSRLEPNFIRLVNATIKVVIEITTLINAARNSEIMTWDVSSGKVSEDLLETRLRSILSQCEGILKSLNAPSTGEIVA